MPFTWGEGAFFLLFLKLLQKCKFKYYKKQYNVIYMKYEFDPAEDKIINGVGIRGLLIGIILILIAVVNTIKISITSESINILFILTIIQNIILIMIAIAFILPFSDYRKLAKTKGKDIKEFMEGIQKMTFGFIIIIIAVLLSVITEIIRLVATL